MKRFIAWVLIVALLLSSSCLEAFADTLKLPRSLKRIDQEAFYNDTSIDTVIVPYGTEFIEASAFAYSSIQKIYIPQTVTSISQSAFEGVDDMIICAPTGSYAEEWAEENDHLFQDCGNYYGVSYFTAIQEQFQDFELEDDGTLWLEGFEQHYISLEAEENESVTAVIEQYNNLESEIQTLLSDYQASANGLYDRLLELSTGIENDDLTYSDDGVSYENEDFIYTVKGVDLSEIGDNYEIVSIESDDGTVKLQFSGNGRIFSLEGNMNGISISEGDNTRRSRGNSGSSIATFALKESGVSDDSSGNLFDKIIAKIKSYEGTLLYLNVEASNAEKKVNELFNLKHKQWLAIEELLASPGEMSDAAFKELQKASIAAEAEFSAAKMVCQKMAEVNRLLAVINPVATIASIKKDWDRWQEIEQIKKHGHPVSAERNDSQKLSLIKTMSDDIQTVQTACVCSAVNSALNLIDQISTVIAVIGTVTGAGALPALAQKAAVFIGLRGTRAMLMSFGAGVLFGAAGDLKYDSVKKIDERLHGGVGGVVTDAETGEPIKNVKVSVGQMDTYTDSKGAYQLRIPEGDQTLVFSKKGYISVSKTLRVMQNMTLGANITMTKEAGAVKGTVKDAKTGNSLSGVTVTGGGVTVKSGSDGTYQLALKAGTGTVTFTLDGYKTYSATYSLKEGADCTLDVLLEKGEDPADPTTPTNPTDPTNPTTPTQPEIIVPPPGSIFEMREPSAWSEERISNQNSSHPEFDFKYHDNYTAELTGYDGSKYLEDWLVIPGVIWRQVERYDPNAGKTLYRLEYYQVISINSYSMQNVEWDYVKIQDGVQTIGDYAFYRTTLWEVSIPYSVQSIGKWAFASSSLRSIRIPDGVQTIGEHAFRDCVSLKSASIPGSVHSISDGAFCYCTDLRSVTISNGVQSIGENAFMECRSLTLITIPDSYQTIGQGAFPDSVQTIGQGAFRGTSLKSITIPKGVQCIESGTFAGCDSLTSITIPDSVQSIGSDAFDGCYNLHSITIPKGVQSLRPEAFGGSGLQSITFLGDAPFLDVDLNFSLNWVFTNVVNNPITCYYPCNNPTWTEEYINSISGNDNVIMLPNHLGLNLENVVEPSSRADGCTDGYSGDGYCNICGKEVHGNVIPALHSWQDGICIFCGCIAPQADISQLQSDHPYASFTDKVWRYTIPGATCLYVTFSPDTIIEEEGYAQIQVEGFGYGEQYSGSELAGATLRVPGDTVSIRLVSGNSTEEYYGFRVISIDTRMPGNPATDISQLQSDHPYASNMDKIWWYTIPGAENLYVTFSSDTKLEEDWRDEITIIDGYEAIVGYYSGSDLAGKTVKVPGDSVAIRLISNESVEEYGFRVTRIDTSGPDSEDIIATDISQMQSDHPYTSNTDKLWKYTVPGADKLYVTFSSDTRTEQNYDFITVIDGFGETVGSYSGSALAGAILEVPGDTVSIRLTSDEGVQAYGFQVTSIDTEMPVSGACCPG